MEWISYGDDNTRTFFTRAKQRKLASYIYQIKDDKGDLVKGFDNVGATMMSYYNTLLGNTTRQKIDTDVVNQGPTLSRDQQVHLCQAFTDLDIKDALYSIPNFKSPKPDGFSSGFVKHTWHKLGTLVCSAIKEFFTKREENEDHLFYDCSYAQEVWGHLKQLWSSLPIAPDNIQLLRYLKNYKGSSTLKQVTSAVITSIFYHIWSARNHRIFKNPQVTASQTAYLIKDQVRSRILFLNTCSKKYSRYIDRLLS
ncbi:LOW QUALITY PROTEIN: hypothetical protein Cgig2_018537 [Carnegiea gigantea]|uniref:Uncharacterized protein n=1 Tax=Carnegiea gigantea TaxID=171969 RepID=A0A9Q1KMR4_9CARY|nr:LOW QUALITY PROTEIN: hypothetical protein Cgig2_018537 [Carnegiea gigantea]